MTEFTISKKTMNFLILLFLSGILFPLSSKADYNHEETILHRYRLDGYPSVFGQYGGRLLQQERCDAYPQSLQIAYGHFADLGKRDKVRKVCKDKVLQPGYQVYIWPFYYVWEKKVKDPGVEVLSSLGGKYKNLIQVIPHSGKFNRFYEYGYRERLWEGGWFPAGYHVRFENKVYIFKDKVLPVKELRKEINYATYEEMYEGLIDMTYCPFHADWYGKEIFPKRKGGDTCNISLKNGYNVYVYPYFFVWETRHADEWEQNSNTSSPGGKGGK